MDGKLMSTIDRITRLTQQNAEFDVELRKRLKVASANSVLSDDERITEIYEYCIEIIIKKQADEFYKDFPLESIKTTLIGDFVRMESFRRKDNFGDFCLALYQQIEGITNELCENSELPEITSKKWEHLAYCNGDKEKKYTIAKLIFGESKEKSKSKLTLQEQSAIDKMKIIVYFLGYKAEMKSVDYKSFTEMASQLYYILQCRNMNHRGIVRSERQEKIIAEVIPLKSLYYFKFYGVLAQYVEYIKEGYAKLHTLVAELATSPNTAV